MDSHGIARPSHPRIRTDAQLQQDLDKIANYRGLEDQVRENAQNKDYSLATLDLTARLLRKNPEYYTVWNIRRKCLIQARTQATADQQAKAAETEDEETPNSHENDLQMIRSELSYTLPLLIGFPKCYWIWNHRSWALGQAIERLPREVAVRVWEEELALASKMLTKDRRNFHAWGYRQILVERLEGPELSATGRVEDEFAYTTRMIHGDLSNFSAWHARSRLLPRLLEERKATDADRKALLDSELALVKEGLNVGPEDQSLWYYHQFLMINLVNSSKSIAPHLTLSQKQEYIAREIIDIKDLLEDYDDIKWLYESLISCTLDQAKLQQQPLSADEKQEVEAWLSRLRKLDPMRNGRWADLEKSIA